MRAVLLIAAKDLRQRLRDRSALVLCFAAPLVISFLMASAFAGAEDLHVTVAVVDEDGADVSAALLATLGSDELADLLTVEAAADRAAAAAAVDDGDADAGLVIPAGFSAAATGGDAAELEVLARPDRTLSATVVRSIAEAVLAEVEATRTAVATALAAGAPLDALDRLAARARSAPDALALAQGELGGRELDLISYYAPGMAVFFALFAVGFTARSWWLEASQGTLDRMRAAPIDPRAVLAGKVLAVFVYTVASLGTVAVATSFAFGAHWGPAPAVAAIVVAMALAATALTALVIALTRTEQQADGLASLLTFALALLGGSFIFVGTAPALLRRLALLTPNGWALRGITDLSTGAPASAAVTPVIAIVAIAAAVAVAAAAVARRRAAA
ncbi:MAG TPA: ABC transporter permease [Acidimicrobiales bacterium]|nr:ABC transporter permease [Acidimicrobiales bacterium]